VHDETLVQLHGGRVARQPNRHRGILYSPVSMETGNGSQVRSGLSAGGRWIRTIGPCREGAGLYCGGELGGLTGQAKNILRGTDGSNPSPSSGESSANLLT
jgi:hypothetical protein